MTSLETLGSTVSIDLHLPGSLRVESVAVFAPETASVVLKAAPGSQTLQKREVIFKQETKTTNKNKPKKKLDRTKKYKYLLRAPQNSTSLGNVGFRHKEIAGFQPQLVALSPTSSEHSLNLESQTRRFCLIQDLRKMTKSKTTGKKRGVCPASLAINAHKP